MECREMKRAGARPSLLGYGCMRFPLDPETKAMDEARAAALIHRAMEGGITYYDTAWPYHDGESEPFLGRTLSRYPRDSYYLATKLPCWEIDSRGQAAEIFARQLERLQTDHLDFYLLHSLTQKTWRRMLELDVLSLLEDYRRQGRICRLGFSFHDAYEAFADILSYRDWDFCQIQLNYMDVNHQAGLRGLELARSRGVPVVIMEPVKGGSLAQLPSEVTTPLKALDPTASDASWALRWVASQPGVAVVLSGMSTPEQLEENLNLFSHFHPLNDKEEQAVEETAGLLRSRLKNGCTGCRYCLPCPKGVDIPRNFQIWNNMSAYHNRTLTGRAWRDLEPGARGDQCVGCGRCEGLCPQHIPVREHLSRLTGEMEEFIK